MRNVVAMSGYREQDIESAAQRAIKVYDPGIFTTNHEIPACMVGNITVSPRRIGQRRIVFLCYQNGKLIGSAAQMFDKEESED